MATTTPTIAANGGLFKVEAAADQLGLSHWTVRAMCRTGRLEHYKIGRAYLISAAEIQRTIDQAKVQR